MPRKPKTPPPVITPLVTPSPASTDWVPLWNLNADPQLPPVVNGQWIKGVGGLPVWSAILPADVGLPKITSQAIASGPPSSPADGDIWIATAVDAAGTVWQFRYNAGSASAYKWEFIGGSPLRGYVGALESTTNTGAVSLTTPGPALTLLRAGEYLFEAGYFGYNTVGPANGACSADLYLNAVNTTESVFTSVSNYTHVSRRLMIPVGTAGFAMTLLYRALTSGTAFFGNRFLNAQPIRVA